MAYRLETLVSKSIRYPLPCSSVESTSEFEIGISDEDRLPKLWQPQLEQIPRDQISANEGHG